ncbi:MAG: ATP-binding cassette domain-containing protein [Phycisphaerales bacterium]|jgi:teichoic acid transport system ATP-binding protein|nr:ATP-binding cassette domain-containing protein [Phycisphaerales bacterium]
MKHGVAVDVAGVGVCYRSRSRLWRPATRHWALREVSFSVREHEVLGIMGPNGSGKTTLCRVLTGIIVPDEGRVDMAAGVGALLGLGRGLRGDLSGRENAVLVSMLLGVPHADAVGALEEVRAFSGLGPAFERPTKTYSSGMRSRLGFAIASRVRPEILVLDEVMSVGDLAFRRQCEGRLEEMRSEAKAIIIVSHSAKSLANICDRVLWLDGGRVRQVGSPDEVLSAYTTWARSQAVGEAAR